MMFHHVPQKKKAGAAQSCSITDHSASVRLSFFSMCNSSFGYVCNLRIAQLFILVNNKLRHLTDCAAGGITTPSKSHSNGRKCVFL